MPQTVKYDQYFQSVPHYHGLAPPSQQINPPSGQIDASTVQLKRKKFKELLQNSGFSFQGSRKAVAGGSVEKEDLQQEKR
jgi:hypothetical protein